jgi:hypothetical protein
MGCDKNQSRAKVDRDGIGQLCWYLKATMQVMIETVKCKITMLAKEQLPSVNPRSSSQDFN